MSWHTLSVASTSGAGVAAMRRRTGAVVVLMGVVATLGGLAAPPGRRPITDLDLLDFVWLADPQLSLDGRTVAMVRVTADRERDGYATAIWSVPADGSAPPRAVTTGPH